MNMKGNKNFWKWTSVVLAIALVAVCCFCFLNKKPLHTVASSPILKYVDANDPLSLWTKDSKLKSELPDYIKRITDKNSKDFIPVKDRVAVFDFDGTLFCETNPIYLDHRVAYHRIVEDETYKDKASDYEKEVAAKIKVYMETGKADDNMPIEHGTCVASSFKGMTPEEIIAYVKNYTNQDEPHYTNMKTKDAYYQPMVQVVDYLNRNGFTVYVVSGTDRFLTRAYVDGALNIPMRQVIGSDDILKASNEDKDGFEYQLKTDDRVVLDGEFQIKNVKMNKVKLIERENGNLQKAEDMQKHCAEVGWTAISMKNDFVTIYGENVKYQK